MMDWWCFRGLDEEDYDVSICNEIVIGFYSYFFGVK